MSKACEYCDDSCDIPYGYCHCGCGEKTKLAETDDRPRGWKAGHPLKFLHGHSGISNNRALTDEDVAQMRYLYATTNTSQLLLARKYGVHVNTIKRALNYETYVEAGIATEEEPH